MDQRMRRTPLLIAAVSLVAAATPAALLAHPSEGKGKAPEAHHPVKAKAPKGTLHLINACVTADAAENPDTKVIGVDLKVLSANRHARNALAGATTFTATLDDTTKIRLVGKARVAPEGSTEKKLPKVGNWDNLDAGDVITVRYRVKRGTALADLGPVWKVTDRGPFAKKCPVPDPKTETPETPPATPAPSL
jgi:hypothetical protein